jgi:hypothetical protein
MQATLAAALTADALVRNRNMFLIERPWMASRKLARANWTDATDSNTSIALKLN